MPLSVPIPMLIPSLDEGIWPPLAFTNLSPTTAGDSSQRMVYNPRHENKEYFPHASWSIEERRSCCGRGRGEPAGRAACRRGVGSRLPGAGCRDAPEVQSLDIARRRRRSNDDAGRHASTDRRKAGCGPNGSDEPLLFECGSRARFAADRRRGRRSSPGIGVGGACRNASYERPGCDSRSWRDRNR
jgi:hypothetical protein